MIAPGSEVHPVRLWRCGVCQRLIRANVARTHQRLAHAVPVGGAVRMWSVVRLAAPPAAAAAVREGVQ